MKTTGATPTEGRHNISAMTEPADPDFRIHAAWLAQVSGAAEGSLAKQAPEQHVPRQDGGNAGTTSSLNTADCSDEQSVPVPQYSRLWMRSGVITMAVVGFTFAVALAAVSVLPEHLWPSASSRQASDRTVETGLLERPTSPAVASGNETANLKLIAQPSRGVAGEPAPLNLSLRGSASDAVVIVRGLMPGAELSAGRAVADDAWQLSVTDLPYASIAPPRDFVGSADLVAELHLPNSEIVDRQSIHVEWTRQAARPEREHEREQMTRGEPITAVPPIASTAVQGPNDRDLILAPTQIPAKPSQNQLRSREESNGALPREKNSSRRFANQGGRRAPFASLSVGDSAHPPKGFWDWSR
jgi:hypothetical protein